MRAVSPKRARLNRQRRKMLGPILAEGRRCEARLPGCQGRSVDGHEVLTRGRGGSIVDLENIALLCRSCHDVITRSAGWADRHGWTVHSWAPETVRAVSWAVRNRWRCPTSCTVDHLDGVQVTEAPDGSDLEGV